MGPEKWSDAQKSAILEKALIADLGYLLLKTPGIQDLLLIGVPTSPAIVRRLCNELIEFAKNGGQLKVHFEAPVWSEEDMISVENAARKPDKQALDSENRRMKRLQENMVRGLEQL